MPKMIKTSDLDQLKDRLASLPPKPKNALNQKEAVYAMAESFKAMLAQDYSVEDAYDRFIEIENAELNIATFRTYLNEAIRGKSKRKQTPKAPRKTRVKAAIGAETQLDSTNKTTPPATVQADQVNRVSGDTAAPIGSKPDAVGSLSMRPANGSVMSAMTRDQDGVGAVDDPLATSELRQLDAERANAQHTQQTSSIEVVPQLTAVVQSVHRVEAEANTPSKSGTV